MKIIFSPTKLMDFKNSTTKEPNYFNKEKTQELLKILENLSENDLGKVMKIKGKTLELVKEYFQKDRETKTKEAVKAYNGISFKQLELDLYDETQLNYLRENLIILSALYGVLRPYSLISQYRLDMGMKILEDRSLYKFWKKEIHEVFSKEELIINLASNEYAKLVNFPMITIDFKEKKGDTFKSVSSYSKKGRGQFLNFMIINKITSIEELKTFQWDGYSYNQNLSKKNYLLFTR